MLTVCLGSDSVSMKRCSVSMKIDSVSMKGWNISMKVYSEATCRYMAELTLSVNTVICPATPITDAMLRLGSDSVSMKVYSVSMMGYIM